jgi:uncharacterized protein YecE (DUF72 family)
MDFGKVPEIELPAVDFTLPPDPSLTTQVLRSALPDGPLRLFVGCAKWGRKEWVGMIYPPKTKEAKFLDEYVKHFNSIELNAVFYTLPKKDQVRIWREKAELVRNDFIFCPKFSRGISHIRRLKNAADETTRYLESMHEFGACLGPAFLQLADNFGPKNFGAMEEYLRSLPSDFPVFVEVRHTDWFGDSEVRRDFFALLHSLNKGAIITDASGRRDCVHMELPTPEAFIRFVGNGLHPTDYSRIDDWALRLKSWKAQGLQSAYFFLHQHDEKDTPILADYAIRKFNETLGTDLKGPGLIGNLFG